MARLTKIEVLRRYQAGERDFRGADLSGLRFRGENLAGSDFSGADLRGTDFQDADLRWAKFSGARCGVPWAWRLFWQGLGGLATGATVGSGLYFGAALFLSFLFGGEDSVAGRFGVSLAIIFTFLLVAGQILFAWEGFSTKGLGIFALSAAIAASLCGAATYDGTDYGGILVAIVMALACGGIFAFAGAVTVAAAGIVAYGGTVAIVFAFAGASVFAGAAAVGVTGQNSQAVAGIIAASVTYLASTIIAFQRSCRGEMGYVGIRSFGVALGALGGTSFSGAELGCSFFNEAQLARASFVASRQQATQLDRVCWKGAWGLELARPGKTILEDPRCRQLLLSGSAPGGDLRGLNLRGAYLVRADLRGADLCESNLCDALLTEANLEKANLKASMCLGADLSGAHLTGATLEGWNIDHTTQLAGVDCSYVYLLEPLDALGQRRDDHHRGRLPHDPDKSFSSGDFEIYFKQVVEEVKLLIKNGVDAKAFYRAFSEMMHQHPQFAPKSIGIRSSGNDVLLSFDISPDLEKGVFEKELLDKYNAAKLESAHLRGLLQGEQRAAEVLRQRAEEQGNHASQLAELLGRFVPPANVPPANVSPVPTNVNISNMFNPMTGDNHAESQSTNMNATTFYVGDGNLINTGSLNTTGGVVNLGALSDQASISIKALPERRPTEGQPSLRELLEELKASIDADTQLPEATRADALGEIKELASAAQDPQNNIGPARRALNALNGLSTGLGETNKAMEEASKFVATIKRLLPLIRAFFLG